MEFILDFVGVTESPNLMDFGFYVGLTKSPDLAMRFDSLSVALLFFENMPKIALCN